jgi:hypothetical protein
MDLPKVRGRLLTMPEGVILVARCPFCGCEHRYNKSEHSEEPLDDILARGFTDEWLPCQHDLPGNFWRIFVGRSRRRRKPGPPPQSVSGAPERAPTTPPRR